MKKNKITKIILGSLVTGATLVACQDSFLDQKPLGALTAANINTKAGVDGLLIAAYSILDGTGASTGNWEAAGSNWVFGSVASDDANKGSEPSDQPDMYLIDRYETAANTSYMDHKWRTLYDGISRTNDVLNAVKQVADISEADRKKVEAEARFLRGHYHFDARQNFEKAPFVDETVVKYGDVNTAKVTNDKEIWPMIEADFKFAMENLPETQPQAGRANKWAAMAYLGKVKMFQGKFAEALTLFNDVIANGKTARGAKYDLETRYSDIYNIPNKNNEEMIFSYQSSVNDGSGAANANAGEVLNFTNSGGPGGCCGFHQPTFDLVNSYKVDALGLPLLDTWNEADLKNDQGIKSSEPFTPDMTTPVDPRLDQNVGRRGVPYHDWGVFPGQAWIRNQAQMGPYAPKKKVYRKAQAALTDQSSWTSGYTAQTHAIIRFADVLLMAAEAEAETGSLLRAVQLVNRVRQRAANAEDFVKLADGTSAANYKVGLYLVFPSKEYALKAIRFERKLELAMEGQRYFDLVRWGIAAEVLNAHIAKESRPGHAVFLQGAQFAKGEDEYYPIPERQIQLSQVNGVSTLQANRNKR